jgi:polyamine oxidase
MSGLITASTLTPGTLPVTLPDPYHPAPAAAPAQRLSVTLLESRGRLGGRAVTVDLGAGVCVDAGASWVHSSGPLNPFQCLVDHFAVKRTATEDYSPSLLFDSDDGVLLAVAEVHAAKERADEMLKRAELNAGSQPHWASASDAMGPVPAGLSQRERRTLDWFLHDIEQYMGMGFSRLSGAFWDEAARVSALDGPDLFVDGVGKIAARIGEALSARATVRLGTAVESVRLVNGEVHVRAATGEVFCATQAAVITLPIGVLKSHYVRFDPPLSPRKLQAIARIGVGVMNKIVLVYKRSFWPREALVIGATSSEWGKYPWFLNLEPLLGLPAVICFLIGEFAKETEQRTDSEIVETAHATLSRACSHHEGQDRPVRHWVTRWATDPHALGSWAVFQAGSGPDDAIALSEPEWGGKLLFAGEHTSVGEQGCIHGAILSGLRAAREVIAQLPPIAIAKL